MLKIIAEPTTFKADVLITVPGKTDPEKVGMTFRYLTKSEQKALTEKYLDNDELSLSEVIVDWSGFDCEFSKENLLTFLDNYRTAPFEIWRAYFKGLTESKVKN